MDKLKPIITHRFWIFFVIALILPTIGWWSATSALVKDTEKKIKTVTTAFGEGNVATAPNPSWLPTAEKLAKLQEKRNGIAWRKLWNEQEQLMNWPDLMKQHVPRKPSGRIDFWGEFRVEARTTYRNQYQDDVERVWLSAKPYIPETDTGQVLLGRNVLPSRIWSSVPTSQEMWEAQQDQWLIEGLLTAVTKMNGNATSVSNAIVRKVNTLMLLGGTGEKSSGEASEGGESPGGEGGYPGGDYGGGGGGTTEDQGGDFPSGQRGTMSEVNIASPGVSFPPTDEFGTGGTADPQSRMEMSSESNEGEEGDAEANKTLRYVGPQEGGMFLRRGFYMEIVIDHRKLPEFLVTLENSSWPTTISRVQMVKLPVQKSGIKAPPKPKISFAPKSFATNGTGEQPESSFGQNDFSTDNSGQGGFAKADANALNNEYLWEVAISGLMVLYNPPPELPADEKSAEMTPDPNVNGSANDPNAQKDGTADGKNVENADETKSAEMKNASEDSSEKNGDGKDNPKPAEKDPTKSITIPEKDDEKSKDNAAGNTSTTNSDEKKE